MKPSRILALPLTLNLSARGGSDYVRKPLTLISQRSKTMKLKVFILGLLFAVFFLVSLSYSQVPQMMNYQGKLTTPAGAIIDTTVSMEFEIYDDSVGGTILWSETQSSVAVEYGVFSVLLGGVNPIPFDVFTGGIRYLGVTIGTSPEMMPRKPMVSVPYASHSGDWFIQNENIYRLTGNVGIGMTAPAEKLDVMGNIHASGSIISGSTLTLDGENNRLITNTGEMYIGHDPNTGNFEDVKVGIGMMTPMHKLDVNGAVNANTYYGDGSNLTGLAAAGGWVDEGTVVRLQTSTDKVGIGTTNPDPYGKLVVAGPFYGGKDAGGYGILINGTQISPACSPGGCPFTEAPLKLATSFEGHIILDTRGGEMRITDDGNVGIGTQTPQNRLDVEGGVAVGASYSGANTAPTNGMIIEGNVGIGTTEPGAMVNTKLDVVGRVSIRTAEEDPTKVLIFDNSLSSAGPMRIYTDATSGTPRDLILGTYPNGHSNQLFLKQSSANVGIGTTDPQNKLDVEGGVAVGAGYSGTSAAPTNGMIVEEKVGIGTANPDPNCKRLHVAGGNMDGGNIQEVTGTFTGTSGELDGILVNLDFGAPSNSVGELIGVHSRVSSSSRNGPDALCGVFADVDASGADGKVGTVCGVRARVYTRYSDNAYGVYIDPTVNLYDRFGLYQAGVSDKNYFAGNVGIGTDNPDAKLTIKGSGVIIRGYNEENPSKVIFEIGEGFDYSETFPTSQDEITPGTVMVIDPANKGSLTISAQAYDRKVAGIVAGANSLGSGVRLGSSGKNSGDHAVALAGRVYCNVDTRYGDIQPGDLLTTSPTAGYAMVVKDFSKAQGSILGKAMEGLSGGGKGQILVLVTLQ